MNLYDEEEEKIVQTNTKPQSQKIVLLLLIVSVLMLIVIMMLLAALKNSRPQNLSLVIDNQNVEISDKTVLEENKKKYISLKEIASKIGYEYLRGEYNKFEETTSRCYLESENQIIGFEGNSNKIYKTKKNSETDYEYYDLENNIIESEGILYIAVDDLGLGCNLYYTFVEKENKMYILTANELAKQYAENLASRGLEINSQYNNRKAIMYNMLVVQNISKDQSGTENNENKNVKMGVEDTSGTVVIGQKYTKMEFDEYTQNFIVSNENGRCGVISSKGNIIIQLLYDNIRIINYSPLLYEVRFNGKVGIFDEKGTPIINIAYDSFGITDSINITEKLVVLKDLIGKDKHVIIACNKQKYGLIILGDEEPKILPCELDKIYKKAEEQTGEIKYKVLVNGAEVDLITYIDHKNTTTVITN